MANAVDRMVRENSDTEDGQESEEAGNTGFTEEDTDYEGITGAMMVEA